MLDRLDDFFDEPLPSTYRVGDRVAEKYTLLEPLGLGGMGEVWAARSEVLDTKVAIKLIRGGSRTRGGQRRLLREARATAKLAEPSIVRVFDFGTTERSEPFIVMEFLDGEDLGRHLETRRRLNPADAIRLLLPVVKALTVAHAAGIVHRDVKPENVFLANTATGGIQPKLLDFGIAQLASVEHLTNSGSTMGSPEYMSPEQARGDDVDASADTWALSVMLYEAVAGKSPFFGRNYNVVIQNILTKEPPPWPDFGDGNEELWHIVRKGLEKNQFDRWRTSKALGRALAGWLSDRGVFDDVTGVSLDAGWGQRNTVRVRSARPPRAGPWAFVIELALPLASATRRVGLRNATVGLVALSVAAAVALSHSKLGDRSASRTRTDRRGESGTAAASPSSTGARPMAVVTARVPVVTARIPVGTPEDPNAPIEPARPVAKPPLAHPDLGSPSEARNSSRRPSKSAPAPSTSAASAASARRPVPAAAAFRNPFE